MFTFARGNKFFELSNHLGNVLVTISDKKLAVDSDNDGLVNYYTADVVTASDYYPFGMNMPGRKFSSNSGYRYGFNGQEKSGEIANDDYDYDARIYDGRLGRWLSVDPLENKYIGLSPFNFCLNNPIKFIDINGEYVIDPEFKKAYPTVALILENADKIYYGLELPNDVKKALEGIDYKKVFNDNF